MLPNGAMVLYYDIAAGAIDDHDDWHTHEHFPERLSIPGFLRASRWVSNEGGPRYLVLYEVSDVPVLTGAPYLERLNNPTPWTARMMVNFRGMARGFCRIVANSGSGLGSAMLSIRYMAAPGRESELRDWLEAGVLHGLSGRPGVVSARMLEPAAKPPMTKEQGIRGKDGDIPCVLLVTGYSADTLSRIADTDLSTAQFQRHGASSAIACGSYHLDVVLTQSECTGARK
jgi:hypothetical protein